LNDNLKQLRADRGISISKMAEIIGVKTIGAYYKKESGLNNFSLLDSKKISDYFGLTINDIFFSEAK
jgi:DNA-binding XRE family transcriptional regulator